MVAAAGRRLSRVCRVTSRPRSRRCSPKWRGRKTAYPNLKAKNKTLAAEKKALPQHLAETERPKRALEQAIE